MPYVAPEVLRGKAFTQAADIYSFVENEEIETQFKEAEEYRKASANLSSIKDYKAATHPQAIYISRLLYPFTKDLPNYNDNDDDYNSECLDCKI
ncbi:kinase-like domain-containing protein [Rhizophagus irregularis DAOM 181602=DAOM 197198]|nr:kinase-like domain-containing protein [Rhizophagus irregularis DAOM 181602=DAOM 197198]